MTVIIFQVETVREENWKASSFIFDSVFKIKNGIIKLKLFDKVSKMKYDQIWATNTSDTNVEFLYYVNKYTLSLRKKDNSRICKSEMSDKCKP